MGHVRLLTILVAASLKAVLVDAAYRQNRVLPVVAHKVPPVGKRAQPQRDETPSVLHPSWTVYTTSG